MSLPLELLPGNNEIIDFGTYKPTLLRNPREFVQSVTRKSGKKHKQMLKDEFTPPQTSHGCIKTTAMLNMSFLTFSIEVC